MRDLIREISRANPLWGAPRIHGELLKLGIDVAQSTVAKYMSRTRRPPSQSWRTFLHNHAGAIVTRNNPYVSPLRASLDELKDLPPALVITAENDPLRDEGEAYARKLKQAGVSVDAVRYNGTIHDFVLLNALRHVPSTEAAIDQINQGLRQHLQAATN